MRAPSFWMRDGVLPALLAPVSLLYREVTARRVSRPGWRAPAKVICCGNATAGGAGKTTVALDIGARLVARGRRPAFLTRGYGGRVRGAVQVVAQTAAEVGDEALLLAAVGPTFVSADRAAGARLAVAAGADVLVMDDGLQNPTLAKDVSLLVIDGASGFGNGRVIPAGPLREPVAAAAGRCQAAVLIGADATGALALLPKGLPVLRAALVAVGAPVGERVLAFAGIGRPEKFFAGLEAAGVVVAERMGFADHYRYTQADAERILAAARRLGAGVVTTPKDAMRLPASLAGVARVVGVRLEWEAPAVLEGMLGSLF